jgi:MarR family transcriptional regulator, lower aerobic nicotinate degradation pathway regulator
MGSHVSRPTNPGPHTRVVLDSIRRIVQSLRESSREAENRAGLSGAQLFVLRTAAESPGLSVSALAERTRTHQSSVSVVVARLARQGLVERRAAEGDARRAEIWLSPAGLETITNAPGTAQERLVAAVDALPAAERARLASTLEGLVREMALGGGRPDMFFEESGRGATKQKKKRRTDA